MKLKNAYRKAMPRALLLATTCMVAAGEKITWSEGHGDLKVNYLNRQWQWHAEQDKPVDDVIIRLNDVTRRKIPNLPQFSFLGPVGENIWIIPTGQTPGIPFMGINAGETPSGTFAQDRFDVSLSSVSGPGSFLMWTVTGTGTPTILMNSRDGIDAQDKTSVPAGGHFHQNWGFTSPGTYRVGFKGSGMLTGQSSPITSDETIYTFEVNVIKKGEADIELAFEEGELQLHIHDELAGVEYDPAQAALQVGPASWQTIPGDAKFSFLGEPGTNLFVLPQAENEDLLFLGLAAAENTEGIFINNELQLKLLNVIGPGSVAYYEINEFGVPTVFFNSKDGINQSDVVRVGAATHSHRNWSFSVPGTYQVRVQASARLLSGETITSQPKTLLFEVVSPVFLAEGEVDIEFTFENGLFGLTLLDEANERELIPVEAVLVVNSQAAQVVPNDPSYSFLGQAGADTYVLSQEEREGILFPGIAADEIQPSVLANETLKVQLVSVQGPGSFALYAIDTFAKPTIFMKSADGVTGADILNVAVGSHSHLNWAFSKPGEYRLNFKISGTLKSNNSVVTSDVITLRFLVEEKETGPQLFIALKDPQNVELSWNSRVDRVYQVQSRTSLVNGGWNNIGDVVPGVSGIQKLLIGQPLVGHAFFRLVERRP